MEVRDRTKRTLFIIVKIIQKIIKRLGTEITDYLFAYCREDIVAEFFLVTVSGIGNPML